MNYVALLRGVNVGGRGIISMADVRRALTAIGLEDVRTHLNSGNALFSTASTGAEQLAGRIEAALEQHVGMSLKVLVMDHTALGRLVDAIPGEWVDDSTMRTYVLLLWNEVDHPGIVDRLPTRPGVDELRYTPGAVIWRVDREDVGRSRMNNLVGTPLYRKITIRSANTMRRLNELTAAARAERQAD